MLLLFTNSIIRKFATNYSLNSVKKQTVGIWKWGLNMQTQKLAKDFIEKKSMLLLVDNWLTSKSCITALFFMEPKPINTRAYTRHFTTFAKVAKILDSAMGGTKAFYLPSLIFNFLMLSMGKERILGIWKKWGRVKISQNMLISIII